MQHVKFWQLPAFLSSSGRQWVCWQFLWPTLLITKTWLKRFPFRKRADWSYLVSKLLGGPEEPVLICSYLIFMFALSCLLGPSLALLLKDTGTSCNIGDSLKQGWDCKDWTNCWQKHRAYFFCCYRIRMICNALVLLPALYLHTTSCFSLCKDWSGTSVHD